MRSDATTVDDYLKSLPEDRRIAIEQVRETIIANLPDGYVEVMNWGMISYEVPLETYPDTYNGRPLMYAGLASQKNYMSVYLTSVYADERGAGAFRAAYQATGKRLDMGKSCVRFKQIDDLPLELIGKAIKSTPVSDFIGLMARDA
jgi:hypothetical protein